MELENAQAGEWRLVPYFEVPSPRRSGVQDSLQPRTRLPGPYGSGDLLAHLLSAPQDQSVDHVEGLDPTYPGLWTAEISAHSQS